MTTTSDTAMTTSANATPAISIHGLCKRYGTVTALDEVSFEVPKNSVFGLLGPNGAGKTTLFSVIADFVRPDRGRAEVLGTDVRAVERLIGRLSILPQDADFERNVPVWDQLFYFQRLAGAGPHEAQGEVERTLGLVGLADEKRRSIQALSHGMRKRLGIAQAFLGTPEVILLDEPTAGLDPHNVRQIRDLIGELKTRATVVVSSHNMAEIQELSDHVAILDRGRLVAAGPVEEITRGGREIDLSVSRPPEAEELAALEAIEGVSEARAGEGAQIAIALDGQGARAQDDVVAEVLRALLDRGLVPRQLREGRSLENEFLRLVGGAGEGDAAAADG